MRIQDGGFYKYRQQQQIKCCRVRGLRGTAVSTPNFGTRSRSGISSPVEFRVEFAMLYLGNGVR